MPSQIENGDVGVEEYFQVKKEDSGLPITGLQVFEFILTLIFPRVLAKYNFVHSLTITQCWAAPVLPTWRWWNRRRK